MSSSFKRWRGPITIHPPPSPTYQSSPFANHPSPITHHPSPITPHLHEELLNEILGHRVDMPRPVDLPAQDLLVDAEGVVVKEGRVAGQHLVQEDAEGPPVHCLVVPLRLDDLWGLHKYCRSGISQPQRCGYRVWWWFRLRLYRWTDFLHNLSIQNTVVEQKMKNKFVSIQRSQN